MSIINWYLSSKKQTVDRASLSTKNLWRNISFIVICLHSNKSTIFTPWRVGEFLPVNDVWTWHFQQGWRRQVDQLLVLPPPSWVFCLMKNNSEVRVLCHQGSLSALWPEPDDGSHYNPRFLPHRRWSFFYYCQWLR